MHSRTLPETLAPDVDVPVRPPRTGVNTASSVRGKGVKEVAVFKVRTEVAIRTRGTGGGRLQVNELAAPVQDEVVPGESCRIGCCSREQGLENAREDAGGRPVALLRSEVFFANALELSGHDLEHAAMGGSAVVADGASWSKFLRRPPSIFVSRPHVFPISPIFRLSIADLVVSKGHKPRYRHRFK